MKIYDKFGKLVKEVTPTINNTGEKSIIHIDGYCEYYVETLCQWINKKNSPLLCIDAGEGLYVWTEELKKFLDSIFKFFHQTT